MKMLEIGDLVDSDEFGCLRLVDVIGRGATGVVFEAERPDSMRRYAIKAIHPSLVTAVAEPRIRGEALILGRLQSPRIVKIYAYFRSKQGVPCIVMERLHGMTLAELVKQRVEINLNEVCSLAVDLLGALDDLHRFGLVHRDIQPNNIVLQSVGANETLLTLIEFGIFKDWIGSGNRDKTFRYAAREQRTEGIVGASADLFAVGVVVYELITGKHPFPGDPDARPTPLLELAPGTPAPIVEAVMASLDGDPERRPALARDFARPFRKYAHERLRWNLPTRAEQP